MKNFYSILANTVVANITTSYLWFALTFWAYLETRSVLATAIIGGMYMLLIAFFGIAFGTFVDKRKKKYVMVVSSLTTLSMFSLAGLFYLIVGEQGLADLSSPVFWTFVMIILFGAVIENMRNIALSTTVTLLVEKTKRDRANGLVGAAQGIGFIVTSALSGLSIGFLGLGWTLLIAIVVTALASLHLLTISIPEKTIAHDPNLEQKKIDFKGSIQAIHAVPGLLALIFFSTFNNLIGGVYMALMDPYGLTIFSVQEWGFVFAVAGTGFVAGGLLIAKFGLGKNPVKTLLQVLIIMGVLGALFTIREWWWLYAGGIWLYMCIVPFAEAAEQTIVQRVVPYERQGRVFGFAQSVESAAAPVTAFMIGPIAEFFILPYMNTSEGQQQFQWLLGTGDVRGIALIFLGSGIAMVLIALIAFQSKSYKTLSRTYLAS
jgi:DHA3 family multidrug efflux protein-like MFS transporter